ncbi:MAG: signal peptidase I [Clostridia bacterium]|nr:signal peptidase I [Clostridia bacterium]NCC44606.1 signal peptidase I [Clostridia bacterium]
MAKKTGRQRLTPEEVIAQKRMKADSADEIYHLLGKIFFLVLILTAAFRFVWGINITEGNDMSPSLKDGDLVLFYRLDRSFVLTDVVFYEKDGVHYYGRITASEGDTVDMNEEGDLLINGSVTQEEIFYPTKKENSTLTFPYTVGEGEYFILGDYRMAAMDSRRLGEIKADEIEGKIIGFFRKRGI